MQDEIKELEKPISNFSFFLSLGAWRTRGLTPYIWSYLEKPFFLKIILRLTDLERLKIFSTESVVPFYLQVHCWEGMFGSSKPRCQQVLQHIWSIFIIITPRNLTWQWTIHHLKMHFLLKMGSFQCHIDFQGCICSSQLGIPKLIPSFQNKAGQGWIVATQKEWPEAPWAAVFAWKKTHKYRVYNMYIYIYVYIIFIEVCQGGDVLGFIQEKYR